MTGWFPFEHCNNISVNEPDCYHRERSIRGRSADFNTLIGFGRVYLKSVAVVVPAAWLIMLSRQASALCQPVYSDSILKSSRAKRCLQKRSEQRMLLLVFCDVNFIIYRHALNYVLLLSYLIVHAV